MKIWSITEMYSEDKFGKSYPNTNFNIAGELEDVEKYEEKRISSFDNWKKSKKAKGIVYNRKANPGIFEMIRASIFPLEVFNLKEEKIEPNIAGLF